MKKEEMMNAFFEKFKSDPLFMKLFEEKTNEAKKEEQKKVLWPAQAEQNARLSQFCKNHNIVPTEQERADLNKIVQNLETRLRDKDPEYRFSARVPVKSGNRTVGKKVWKRKSKKNEEPPDLFATAKK